MIGRIVTAAAMGLAACIAYSQQPSRTGTYHDPVNGVSFRFPSTWKQVDPKTTNYHNEGWPMMPKNSDGAAERPRATIVFEPGRRYGGTILRELSFTYASRPAPDFDSCLRIFHADEAEGFGEPYKKVDIAGRAFEEFTLVNDGACDELSDTVDVIYAGDQCFAFDREIDKSCYDPAQTGGLLTHAEWQAIDRQLARIMQSVRIESAASPAH